MTDVPNQPPGGQQPPPGGQQPPPPGGQQPPPPGGFPPAGGQPAPPPGGFPPSGGQPGQFASPQYPPQQPSGIGAPGDLGTRILARIIDAILIGIVNAILVTTLLFGVVFSGAGAGVPGFGSFTGWGLLGSLISAAINIGYFAFMESTRGQTVGKMLLKLQVQGPSGQHPSLEESIKRNAWLALSIVPIVGGLLSLAAVIFIMVTINNNTATRQGWHDEFAGGTRVIKVG